MLSTSKKNVFRTVSHKFASIWISHIYSHPIECHFKHIVAFYVVFQYSKPICCGMKQYYRKITNCFVQAISVVKLEKEKCSVKMMKKFGFPYYSKNSWRKSAYARERESENTHISWNVIPESMKGVVSRAFYSWLNAQWRIYDNEK